MTSWYKKKKDQAAEESIARYAEEMKKYEQRKQYEAARQTFQTIIKTHDTNTSTTGSQWSSGPVISGQSYPAGTTSASGGTWVPNPAPYDEGGVRTEIDILARTIDEMSKEIRALKELLEATAGGLDVRLADVEEDLYGT